MRDGRGLTIAIRIGGDYIACRQAMKGVQHMDADAVIRFRAAIGRLARDLNAAATDEHLTPTQASVLALVARREQISLAELTEVEGINPTMLSRVVGNLDAAGLIHRSPDPSDLRSVHIAITAEGQTMQQRIRDERAAIISRCMSQLSEGSVAALMEALPALEALSDEVRLTVGARRGVASRASRDRGARP